MFKSKGAMFGIAAATLVGMLLVAGMTVSTTSGAPTDISIPGSGLGNIDLTAPDSAPGAVPGNPPASPVEPPITNPTDPTTNPSGAPAGAAGAGAGAPGSLPNAGFGIAGDNSGSGSLLVLLGLAGMVFVGAGASVVASRRD
jgi:hypothetical protein